MESYDENYIRNVTQLKGYGVAYSGAGHAGLYKLEMTLNGGMTFVTKIGLHLYDQPINSSCLF